MEHYKKKQSRLFDSSVLTNEIKVSGSSKAHDLCTKAAHMLKEHASDGIVVSASGSHVTKAVTVVELLKRRIPTLHQDTQLKYIKVEDVWEPDMEDLDSLKVVRRIPAISMHLVESPTSSETPTAEGAASLEGSGNSRVVAAGKDRKEKGKGQGSRVQSGESKKPGKRSQGSGSSKGGNYSGKGKGRGKSSQQTNEPATS